MQSQQISFRIGGKGLKPPNDGQFQDLARQSALTSCLDHASVKKGWTR